MTELLTQAKENLSFILMCILIVVALSLLSKFAEKFFPQKRAVTPARRITIIAICSSIPPEVGGGRRCPQWLISFVNTCR